MGSIKFFAEDTILQQSIANMLMPRSLASFQSKWIGFFTLIPHFCFCSVKVIADLHTEDQGTAGLAAGAGAMGPSPLP